MWLPLSCLQIICWVSSSTVVMHWVCPYSSPLHYYSIVSTHSRHAPSCPLWTISVYLIRHYHPNLRQGQTSILWSHVISLWSHVISLRSHVITLRSHVMSRKSWTLFQSSQKTWWCVWMCFQFSCLLLGCGYNGCYVRRPCGLSGWNTSTSLQCEWFIAAHVENRFHSNFSGTSSGLCCAHSWTTLSV